MCGIAGILNYKGNIDSKELVVDMLDAINYRGPDERGIYYSKDITLGNARLSIIDLKGGTQPLSDQTGRYWIVYNGEIFNYLEIKEELLKEGYTFSTDSDTEVLVQLFSRDKEKCLNKLNGQFAFAIWDKYEKSLFIARDRTGIRPLFYSFQDGKFSFASEIKSLFQLPFIRKEFESEGLKEIFTCWANISPSTAYKDIRELPPGHFLLIQKDKTIIEKYWELDFSNVNMSITLEDALEEFTYLLRDAIRIRLRADVEVGAYLSGGIDSSATTAFIKQIEPQVLNTFSIVFEDAQFDESRFQAQVSDYLNTRHQTITCKNTDIADNFYKAVYHAEFPVLRTAMVPMMMLSGLVKDNNIKVVITGEGADEFLGGYNIFKENEIRNFWARQPDSKLRPLLLKKLYPYISYINNARPEHMRFFFGYRLNDINNPFYSHLLRWNNSSRILNYLNDDIKNEMSPYNIEDKLINVLPSGFYSWSSLAKAQWLESRIFMSEYLLSSQGDRMAMANSVEGRYPFLDHRLIEFLSTLPGKMKLNGLNEKYLLKKKMKGSLPDSIINRSKQAYRAPVANSLLNSSLENYISENNIKNAGIFSFNKVQNLTEKIKSGKNLSEIDNMSIAAILSTQILYDQFISGKTRKKPEGFSIKTRVIEEKIYT